MFMNDDWELSLVQICKQFIELASVYFHFSGYLSFSCKHLQGFFLGNPFAFLLSCTLEWLVRSGENAKWNSVGVAL